MYLVCSEIVIQVALNPRLLDSSQKVRPPALHGGAPVVHVAGHFSFEEGGPLVPWN